MRLLLVAAVLSTSPDSIADTAVDAVEPSVRLEMTALVELWIDAEVRSNGEALAEILHEDFLSTFASGTTLGRDAYIDFIIGLDISPFKVINESMVQHGEIVVVIDVSEDGGTKFTWVAAKQDGQWRVISQTFSRIAAADEQ
ncbi:MAG: nuclear transport factor 2 family protein [Woeseiaceae bacterium]